MTAALPGRLLASLPERLRDAINSVFQPQDWPASPKLARLAVMSAVERAWPTVLAELAAERPESAAALTPAVLAATPLARAAYRAHNTWCWAKEQLRILAEMAQDRIDKPDAFLPLSPDFLAQETVRIRDGVELLPEGLLTAPVAAPAERPKLAGWEAVEAAAWGTVYPPIKPESGAILSPVGHAVTRVLAALKPLWPAPPPPAAWQAIEAAMRRELPCICTGSGGPREVHHRTCPARDRAAVLSALRSVELASAARAARLEVLLRRIVDGKKASISWPGWREKREAGERAIDEAKIALAAQPSDPWAALMALLADLDADAERREIGAARILARHSEARDVARRIREALGLSSVATTTGQHCDIPDFLLVERAARNAGRLATPKVLRWVAVKGVLATGSTYSIDLCRRFGLDPHEMVGLEPQDEDDGEAPE